MISFVVRLLLLLLRLFAEIAYYLFGGDSKHLRWEASVRSDQDKTMQSGLKAEIYFYKNLDKNAKLT